MDFLTSKLRIEHPIFSEIFEGLKFGYGIVNLRGFPIKYKSIEDLLEYISKVEEQQKNLTKDKVQLMTFHKSKGLEADTVFLVGKSALVFALQQMPESECCHFVLLPFL